MQFLCEREGGFCHGDLHKCKTQSGRHIVTVHAAMTLLIASESKLGLEGSAGGSGTQRYVWNS
jgi:hypothetical protein